MPIKWINELMDDDITNGHLARVFSIDFLLATIAAIFIGGVIWANLNVGISQAQEVAHANRTQLQSVTSTVTAIERDVAVIKANQKNATDKLDDQSKELDELRKDIKQILRNTSNGHND